MKGKYFFQKGLVFLLCLSFLNFLPPGLLVQAKEPIRDTFHYAQLTELGQSLYDGLSAMYETGLLKTGNADYDLVKNGHLTSQQVSECLSDRTKLKAAMDAARYAFYADHPEIFYVDFPKLTYRITKGADRSNHIYLGPGRYETYYLDGFSKESEVDAALTSFDARINEIVSGAKAVTVPNGQSLQAAQVRYVHNEIINHASYRLEDTCFEGAINRPSNAPFLGTPYGILVTKQGVCEGYSRAFKAVLDRLGIHSILVQGVHQYDSEVVVAHMWNYVEITDTATRSTGQWYAVDLTQDDPEMIISSQGDHADYLQHFNSYGLDGFENEKYLLVGDLTMNSRHFVNESVEAAGGYTFSYPKLTDNDFGMKETINNTDGFLVKQKTVPSSEGFDVTEFSISYRGMNVTKAKKEGIYFLARYYDYGEGEFADSIVPVSNWGYITDAYALKEDETSVYIQEGQVMYMEFAVTTVRPREGLAGLTYAGDEYGLVARTGKLYNENQTDYMAPPYVLKQAPSQAATFSPGGTYHIKTTFTEKLTLMDGITPETIGYRIDCKSTIGEAVSGAEYTKIKNIRWDGESTVEFDVTFSSMFADNSIAYNIYITGLVGEESKKAPNPIVYAVRKDLGCPSIMALRGSWDVFGKPTLLENADLSVGNWQTANGKPISEKLEDRLALVTTKTTDTQNTQMSNALDQEFPGIADQITSSSTYNITLTVCKTMVIQTGSKVRVQVGFPDGCGPNDAGTTYKAYHFKRDTQGNVTGVEEIDCVVTPYGLIITCDAFSPFMVAAVKTDSLESVGRTLVTSASDGGTITGPGLDPFGMEVLSENKGTTLSVNADPGYVIDSILVGKKTVPVTDTKGMEIPVHYDDLGTDNVVMVHFAAESVAKKESDRNETPVTDIAPVCTHTNQQTYEAEPSTCTTPGHGTYLKCNDCGMVLSGSDEELPLLPHTYEEKADPAYLKTEATCKDQAVYFKSCSACGDISTETFLYGERKDHGKTVVRDERPAGCTTDGYTGDTYCTICDTKVSEGTEIPATGHSLTEIPAKEATHEADGNHAYYECSTCHKLFCDKDGSTETTMDDIVLAKGEHVYGEDYVSDGESHWRVCGCGHVSEKSTHTMSETAAPTYLKSEATCMDEAVYYKSCSVCGKPSTETFSFGGKSPHKETIQKNQQEATCTRNGYTGDAYCTVCGVKVSNGLMIPPAAHTLSEVPEKMASHETDGNRAYYECNTCHKLFLDMGGSTEVSPSDIVTPKTGHAYQYASDGTNHWNACDCGSITDKAPHTFGNWDTKQKPSATNPGQKERACTVCGYKETKELPATGRSDAPVSNQKPQDTKTTETPKTPDTKVTAPKNPEGTLPKDNPSGTTPVKPKTETVTEGSLGTGSGVTDTVDKLPVNPDKGISRPNQTEKPAPIGSDTEQKASAASKGIVWAMAGITVAAAIAITVVYVIRKRKQSEQTDDDAE